ncbi:4-carboxymuconolactone decarboxylase [Streptomyces sp. TRM 70361]|uniref:bifunctional 3-oxoadipate enol-lactonase/4-carboxymuconolactone decarboxylase PcaDC n=1 Tax=Streptomyces sp. TRM 70361 TaxID=3116553 RepID=UPI002E7ADADA|nr:4-carboxymuconolactone decarboxylase [Streptomyces sp. TRM 70361]MEE1941290.1 4-carboxymuconolactone decarboxylase [Streptomyces sp. TRM 70361]
MTRPTGLPHHRLDGPADGVPLILGPSLGTSLAVWEPQLAALARDHRVLRWDLPGHGGSPAALLPGDGTAGLADLAHLVLALADARGWERFAYAGISLGGAVGLHLAAHHPERVTALAVVCSSAHFGGAGAWRERAATVRELGTGALVASRPGTWFAPGFEATPRGAALLADLCAADDAAYAVCCEVLAGCDLRGGLAAITAPTLVVAGRDDPATPPAHAREIADGVPGASLTEIARAAHLANVERPAPVLAVLLDHLAAAHGHPDGGGGHSGRNTRDAGNAGNAGNAEDTARHRAGLAVRRAVLGDEHVDRALARANAFTEVFQDFITRYAWGEIWTRPGLDRRTRSCVTLTALVAGGHHEELALHVRAALRNGLTPEDIREVLLQTAVYCGVPAANSAFAVADRILNEPPAHGN